MKTVFQKLNFGILSMRARVRVIITGKLIWCRFFGNKISKSERNFQKYLYPEISHYTDTRLSESLLWLVRYHLSTYVGYVS